MGKGGKDKSVRLEQLRPELKIEFSEVVTLGDFWNLPKLLGVHWRLYHNDAPGCGIILPDGTRKELVPDFIYILTPCPSYGSYYKNPAEHLVISFHLENCYTKIGQVFQIPIDSVLGTLMENLRTKLLCHPISPDTKFDEYALAGAALAKLPEGILQIGKPDERIMKAENMLRCNPGIPWSSAELAQKLGFSTNAFTRRFREVMGITPYHYLQNLRYALAAQLLESTTLSIDEICVRIGVPDRSHFTREFRRFHERTPAVYRKTRNSSKFAQ